MKCWNKLRLLAALALTAILLSPSPALACAACFGKSDSDLAKGLNWGIFSLLAVVLFVLGSLATFFIYIARRTAAMAEMPDTSNALTTKS